MGHPVNKAYPKDRRVMAPGPKPKFGLLLPQTDGKNGLSLYYLLLSYGTVSTIISTLCLHKNCKPQQSVWLTPYEMTYLYTK